MRLDESVLTDVAYAWQFRRVADGSQSAAGMDPPSRADHLLVGTWRADTGLMIRSARERSRSRVVAFDHE
jgi:hypothetical protein